MTAYARPLVHQDETLREVQRVVDRQFEDRPLRDVLDAGCGYALPLDFPRSARLVGLDASAEALEKNRNVDVGIVGDLQTYPLDADAYDVVLCWNVLEHLTEPRTALANMARALRPGGIMVIGIPNVRSLKGLVTRFTPYRFHVWVYRRILGKRDAGKPGFGPYPTHLSGAIAPDRLHEDARSHGLERIHAVSYDADMGMPRWLAPVWSAATLAGRVLTLGAWKADASDHVAVFRKRASA